MSKLTLVVDMDEVLVDLSDKVRKCVNSDFGTNHPKGFNQSYWWSDYNIQENYFKNLLHREGLFYNADPIEGGIKALTKLHEEGYDIHILTFPQQNLYCYHEKVEWVKKYLPFIDVETNFHATGNKGMFAKENRLLIDDNVKYLDQFSNNGGMALAFGNYGWNKDYKGDNAADWNEVYDFIKSPNSIKELATELETYDLTSYAYNSSNIDLDKLRNYMARNGYYE